MSSQCKTPEKDFYKKKNVANGSYNVANGNFVVADDINNRVFPTSPLVFAQT